MKVLLGGGDGGAAKRQAANVEAMEALENVNSPTTPNGTPLLQRLGQLEEQMSTLEEKYSPRGLAKGIHSPVTPSSLLGSPTTPSSLEKRCRPAKSVLLEAEAKGTLVERVQLLEKRISRHSVNLDKTFSSGRFGSTRFGSNGFDPKHLDPHYLQEAPKLAETEQARTEVLESGKATSEEVLLPSHIETAAPETLVTEVSTEGQQEHETPELAPETLVTEVSTEGQQEHETPELAPETLVTEVSTEQQQEHQTPDLAPGNLVTEFSTEGQQQHETPELAPETLVTEVPTEGQQHEASELAPETLVKEVSTEGQQQHETPELARVTDDSISSTGAITGETASMQSSEDLPAKPVLVDDPPTQVPAVTSNDSILDSATSERSVAGKSATAASAESATELEMKNVETNKANHTPVTAAPEEPLVAVTKQEPSMRGSLGGSAVGKQLDESMKESMAKAQEEKPMKVVENPVVQAGTAPPASDPGYISKPQPLPKKEKKRRFKNLRERYRLMFKNKNEAKLLS